MTCKCNSLGSLSGEDPWIVWPGTISNLKEQTNTEIKRIARDMEASIVMAGAEKVSFDDFESEWLKYYTDLDWFDGLTGATWERIQEYRDRAREWDELLRSRGAMVSGPAPRERDKGTQLADAIKWGAVLAAILVGGYVAAPAVKRLLR